MTDQQLRRYLQQASQHLYCSSTDRDHFAQQIRTAAAEIEKEQPGASWDDCLRILGTPQQAAREYMQDFSPDSVNQYKKQRRLRHCAGIAALAAVIAVLLGFTCYWWFIKEFTVVEVPARITSLLAGRLLP